LIISNPTASVGGTLKYYEIGSTGSQDITISLGSDGEYKYGYDPNPASLKDGDLSTLIINDKTTGVAIDTSVSSPCVLTVDGESIAPKENGGSIFTLSPSARTDRAELKVVGTIYYT
jgi:hypothetical protein